MIYLSHNVGVFAQVQDVCTQSDWFTLPEAMYVCSWKLRVS